MPFKNTVLRTLAFVSFVFLLAAGAARADQVRLSNGDVIRGQDLTLADGNVKLNSPALGDLTIPQDKVQDVTTDELAWVSFNNGYRDRGTLTPASPGWMRLHLADGRITDAFNMSVVTTVQEGSSAEPPKEMWKTKGGINVGGTSTNGNTESDLFHADGKITARKGDTRLNARAEANYRNETGEETANNWLLKLKHDHFFSEKWFFYTAGGLEHDSEEELDLRSDIGSGAGYQFVDTPRAEASVESGLSYVHEDYSVGADDSYVALRWSSDLRYDPVIDKFRLFHYHEILQGISGGDSTLLSTRTGVRYFVAEGLNATAQVNYDWTSDPAPGEVESDTAYIFSVGYAW